MMRELFKARMGLAVLAGLGLSSLAATSADAALITMELRPTSATTGLAAGAVVTFDIYAVVTNGDNNKANDSYNLSNVGFTSVEGAGSPVQGNIAPVTFSSNSVSPSTPGSQMNRDGNPDLEVGGADPNVAAGWAFLTTGLNPTAGTGTTGNFELLLGSTSWTHTGGLGSTDVNIFNRVRTTGNPTLSPTIKYTSDGVVHSEFGNDPDVAVGPATTITVVPEPAALGLIGLGALAAVRRRRA